MNTSRKVQNHSILKKEVWKTIKGFEQSYMVSSFGRVKSLDKKIIYKNGHTQSRKGKILKSCFSSSTGYYRVNLSKNSKIKTCTLHVLVAKHFIDAEYTIKKLHCNHIDGDKSNNKLSNLEVVTKSQNELHAFRIGLKSHKGENHNIRKLNQKQVDEIRALILSGVCTKKISSNFGISRSHVYHIKNYRTWL